MTDRTELRRLLDKATPRPWHVECDETGAQHIYVREPRDERYDLLRRVLDNDLDATSVEDMYPQAAPDQLYL